MSNIHLDFSTSTPTSSSLVWFDVEVTQTHPNYHKQQTTDQTSLQGSLLEDQSRPEELCQDPDVLGQFVGQ